MNCSPVGLTLRCSFAACVRTCVTENTPYRQHQLDIPAARVGMVPQSLDLPPSDNSDCLRQEVI